VTELFGFRDPERALLFGLFDLVRIDQERREAFGPFELGFVVGGFEFALERANANSLPEAALGDVGGLAKRVVTTLAQIFDQLISVGLVAVARDLQLMPEEASSAPSASAEAECAIAVSESFGSVVTGVALSSVPTGKGTTGKRSVAGGGALGLAAGSTPGCWTSRPRSSFTAASAVVGVRESLKIPGKVTSWPSSCSAGVLLFLALFTNSASGSCSARAGGPVRFAITSATVTSAAPPRDASNRAPSRDERAERSSSWICSRLRTFTDSMGSAYG
jgi:hypothetical protein